MTKNIKQALQVLSALGFPRAQQNERSALCLLALLDLMRNKTWAQAANPLMGITPIMDWARLQFRIIARLAALQILQPPATVHMNLNSQALTCPPRVLFAGALHDNLIPIKEELRYGIN